MSECSTPTSALGWILWAMQSGGALIVTVVAALMLGALALDTWDRWRK